MGGRLAGRNGQALGLKGFRLVLATDHGRHNTGVSHVFASRGVFCIGLFLIAWVGVTVWIRFTEMSTVFTLPNLQLLIRKSFDQNSPKPSVTFLLPTSIQR